MKKGKNQTQKKKTSTNQTKEGLGQFLFLGERRVGTCSGAKGKATPTFSDGCGLPNTANPFGSMLLSRWVPR